MIKVNELRVGNYIIFKEFGEGDGEVGEMKRGDFGRFNNEEYLPIPITPKWLKKCGFKKMNAGWINDSGSLSFYDASQDEEGWFTMEYGTRNHRARFKHVHQLQNLYFALTGEELTIKKLRA